MKLIVCGTLNDESFHIGMPFEEKDVPFIKQLIQLPVATQYGTVQPENMWIERYKEKYDAQPQ